MPKSRSSVVPSEHSGRKRLIVVGGGIAGLAAARSAADRACERGLDLEVVLLEREAAVGGKAVTWSGDGWQVEGGPTAYLDNEPALDRLVKRAGLASSRLAADAAAANRFILWKGRMRPVAAHPVRLARSGLLSPWGFTRLLLEALVPPRRYGREETVWEFACRRLGCEAAERMIAPMTLGVFAGDARKLSLPAAFPRIAALEREYGSLVRGMIRRRGMGGGSGGPAGTLTSFAGGMQTLPNRLASGGEFAVRCRAEVAEVVPEDGAWRVAFAGSDPAESADAVVLAGEAWSVAPLVVGCAPSLASYLAGIDYPPVTVVALGFGQEGLRKIPRGFGVLVPRGEGLRMLGCLWDSYLFPGRSPEAHVQIRAMLGGAVDPAAGVFSEELAVEVVEREVAGLFGLEEPPGFRRVVRWPRAIPQYTLGHASRVEAIEREAAALPGLFLAGNYLYGISFGRAAASGVEAGERVVGFLTRR